MNYRVIFRVVGVILVAVGVAMIPPAVLTLFDDTMDKIPFLVSSGICLLVGFSTLLATKGRFDLRLRDGFAIVTFGWLAAAVFGSLPYWISGACTNPIDAFFESVSGFTTTGSTIFDDIEALPHGILLWRSMTQWLGGMGIVVLSVAVLPALGVGGMQLFKAEMPGPTADRLSPRITSTAKILWGVYLALTVSEAILLVLGGMTPFDAICHAFSTVSTGGFSTRNASVGAFDSAYIQWVIIFFMFIAGANFSLHFWLLRGRWKRYWRNEEFRFYAVVSVLAIAALWIAVETHTDLPVSDALRAAAFQTVSISTSTGFGTSDYLLWGFGAQILILILMLVGGCAGSTAGGIKLMRVELLSKHAARVLKQALHPKGVFNVRHSGTLVSDEVMMNILGFLLLYILVVVTATLFLAVLGVDPLTAIGASVSMLSNVGPGLGEVGPASTYSGVPLAAKMVLAICQLLGRLEFFTVLVLVTPMFWRRI